MAQLIDVSAKAKPADDKAANRVVINFTNDHDIDGARFDVLGVSSEQLFVAIAYLTRIANQMLDARIFASERGQQEIAAMAAQLAKKG